MAGTTGSKDFPTPGGFDTIYSKNFGQSAYVSKIDASGSTLLWSSYLEGNTDVDDLGRGIAVVRDVGEVYVVGWTYSSDFPLVNAFDQTIDFKGRDAFVTKVAASGSSLLWSSYLGGGAQDFARDVATDGAGNAYVTGDTWSWDFPVEGGFNQRYWGADGFVTKVDASGSGIVWSSFLGFRGRGPEEGRSIAVDASGNVYITGLADYTELEQFDAFVIKVDASGAFLSWSSYLGGSDNDFGRGIAVDGLGDVYLVGDTGSSDFPTGGFGGTLTGPNDAFVTKIFVCGNGSCDPAEDPCSCALDCGPDACGNDCCGEAEDSCTCPVDCPGDCCGDGVCGDDEDCGICPGDCGPCAEPRPDPAPDLAPDAPPDLGTEPRLDAGPEPLPDLASETPADMSMDELPDVAVADAVSERDAQGLTQDAASSMDATLDTGGDLAATGRSSDGCACELRGRGSAPWLALLTLGAIMLSRRRRAHGARR